MKTVSNAREFFDEVLEYNLAAYKADPTCLPAAYNLASALFSMHEWMWHSYKTELKTVLGTGFDNEKTFNKWMQEDLTAYMHMRDLANASKHFVLREKSASTAATKITDTVAIESKYGEGVYGESKYGRGVVAINDGGKYVDFEDTAIEVYEFWGALLSKIKV
jgi:hypothetical protein